MPKQTVPDIEFCKFVLAEIPKRFAQNEIKINQRGDIWKQNQKIELMRSIINGYSIGVLVLYINDNKQYEILDGQQRLNTIKQYLDDKIDLSDTDLPRYKDLNFTDKTLLDAYCVFYLKLKSHDAESKEEDIVQTFLRLQEGTPLNKAEKINAHRGEFKDTFRKVREEHAFFGYLGNEKRFRWRQLAAEMLLIELEADFHERILPDIDLPALIAAAKRYERRVSTSKTRRFIGNLDIIVSSLAYILTAFTPREAIAFYLLVSGLRETRADNSNIHNELHEFAAEFLKNLYSFSLYDSKPPKGMEKEVFDRYVKYKMESKVLTTASSLRNRFEIMRDEFDRMHSIILKDPERLHDAEQKRTLYFRQKGLCAFCQKPMVFQATSSHHGIAHSKGGKTDDLEHAALYHEKCHKKVHKTK
jgi:hypothetical protein